MQGQCADHEAEIFDDPLDPPAAKTRSPLGSKRPDLVDRWSMRSIDVCHLKTSPRPLHSDMLTV